MKEILRRLAAAHRTALAAEVLERRLGDVKNINAETAKDKLVGALNDMEIYLARCKFWLEEADKRKEEVQP